jgi:hypothetical protein
MIVNPDQALKPGLSVIADRALFLDELESLAFEQSN